jgi:hypothetical protein
MAKLASAFSFLALYGMNHFEKTPDVGSASLRLALALVFAAALVVVIRTELDEFIG